MQAFSIILFVIIRVLFCCDDPNQISILPPFQDVRNIYVKIGEDLNIVCCHPDGAEKLRWRNKTKHEINFKNNNGLFSLRDEKNRFILRIDNIDESKMGEYTCSNDNRDLSKSIMISAKSSAFFPDIIKRAVYFPRNRPIQIKCPLNDNQLLKNWIFTRGGKNIVVSKTGSDGFYDLSKDKLFFTVKIVEKQDNIKIVWCQFQEVATNGDVKTSLYEFTWTIYEPIDTQLIIDHRGPILESNDVKLICSFRYNPRLKVTFSDNVIGKSNIFVNDGNLKNGKVVVTINKITKDLEGEYECKITDTLNTDPLQVVEEVSRVQVDVVLAPKIISTDFVTFSAKMNDDVYLSCQIKSKQLDDGGVYFEHYRRNTSQWVKLIDTYDKYKTKLSKNGINILTLLIKKVTWEDRGQYKCVAKNAAGEDSKVGLFRVEKTPELKSSGTIIYIATKPVRIECSVSGYPLSSTDDKLELKVLNKVSSLDLKEIERQDDDIDGLSVVYEVAYRAELTVGSMFQLECYFKCRRSNLVLQKRIDLKIAQKPSIPVVNIVCSGSSGIVFKYQIVLTTDENLKMVKNVLSYAPSEEFDSLVKKPTKVIPIRDDETQEYLIYVLKDLVASRKYTFKWESFNVFGLSNERSLIYSTKDLMPPQTPKILQFYPKGNMINVNVTWEDECPYTGSNSAIRDIVVTMKPLQTEEGKRNIYQWTEKNITFEMEKSSAQFLINLENPRIDYEFEVALRSLQGTSDSMTGVYRANVVLAGAWIFCFPRCCGILSSSGLSLVHVIFAVVFSLVMKFYCH